MCWSCIPWCGKCKPPKERLKKCPDCSHYNFPELKKCKRCGATLPESVKPPTVMCLYIGKLCANPCGKYKAPSKDGVIHECKWHTPANESTTPESGPNMPTDKQPIPK